MASHDLYHCTVSPHWDPSWPRDPGSADPNPGKTGEGDKKTKGHFAGLGALRPSMNLAALGKFWTWGHNPRVLAPALVLAVGH